MPLFMCKLYPSLVLVLLYPWVCVYVCERVCDVWRKQMIRKSEYTAIFVYHYERIERMNSVFFQIAFLYEFALFELLSSIFMCMQSYFLPLFSIVGF